MPSAWISSGWYLPTDRKPVVKEEKSRRKEVDEPEPEARSLCLNLIPLLAYAEPERVEERRIALVMKVRTEQVVNSL